jgi:hypothetical protein
MRQSNFHPGNEPIPDNTQFPQISKETKEALVNDMREAIASGPFTGGLDVTPMLVVWIETLED